VNRLWAILFLIIPLLAVAIFIASAAGADWLTWLPASMSTHAGEVDHLLITIHWVGAVVLLLTGLLLGGSLLLGHSRQSSQYFAGQPALEVLWTVIPAGILVALAVYQSGTWSSNKIEVPRSEAVTARVIARQFDWQFVYPGDDGVLGTADDLSSVNQLVVPRDRVVVLELQSEDVIHSFFVPKLRLKQDIVPGKRPRVWFSPTGTGHLEIVCAELCGWGHYNMRAAMRIVTPDQFATWLEDLRSGGRVAAAGGE